MLESVFAEFIRSNRKILVLSGAGLSADSGIPTFRDTDGFWTVGSKNYMPEEMGTFEMYQKAPLEVWKWFLYRLGICRSAQPNIGHYAIRDLELLFGDRFRIISQNIDGLHHRAGNSKERIYEIHGTLDVCRCGSECSKTLYPFPNFSMQKEDEFTEEQKKALVCPACGNWLRPHVLWFDECYDEPFYKIDSTLRAAKECGLLLIVGTSGATTLPRAVVETALSKGAVCIDINKKTNYFSELLQKKKNGYFLQGPSSEILPQIVKTFQSLMQS